ncbi:hypothetical protein AAK913_12180 [Enterococcus faecium]|uniref:hypothetical protein n=1 Tax=Enterococcus faecium TaxID=1352 RepID=UPI003517357C|nr:hypothetical protein [Enterococcus faecium]
MSGSKYEKGLDEGYVSASSISLNFLSKVNPKHVQELAETLGVTHEILAKLEGEENICIFENFIDKNSSYWDKFLSHHKEITD